MAENPDIISSDSEDSILEVPVPPKPPPLLIDINDSDESSSGDEEMCGKIASMEPSKSTPRVDDDSDVSSIIVENSPNSNLGENNNLILNCTEIQPEQTFHGIRELLAHVNTTSGARVDEDDQSADRVDTSSRNTPRKHVSNQETSIESPVVDDNQERESPITQKRPRKSLEADSLNVDEEQARKKLKSSAQATADVPFDEYIFQPVDKSIEAFYSEPCHEDSTKDIREIQKEMSDNPYNWSILSIDRQGGKPRSRGKICATCQKEGHTRDRCPGRRKIQSCHMCGKSGHIESRCPDSMCLTCGTKYSTYRKTCEYCRTLKCSTCKGVGHKSNNCPDLWRRYHQTTSGTQVDLPANSNKVLKPSSELWCCNCTKNGHDSTTCSKYRWSQHFVTPRFVTCYNKAPFYESRISEIAEQVPELSNSIQINSESQSEPVAQPSDPQLVKNNKRKSVFIFQNFVKNLDTSSWVMKKIETKTLDCQQPVLNEYPTFLKAHFPLNSPCKMMVQIYRLPLTENVEIEVKGPVDSIELIEKLLLQWLARNSDDRKIMNEVDCLPWNCRRFLICFQRKCRHFSIITNPHGWKRHKKITEVQNIIKSVKKTSSQRKLSDAETKNLNHRVKTLTISKRRLVAGVYNYGMIPTAKQTLEEFQNLLGQVNDLPANQKISSTMYMAGLWFDFELFTPHYSSYIATAAEIWESQVLKLPNLGKRHRASEDIQKIQRLLPKNPDIFSTLPPITGEDQPDSCDEETSECSTVPSLLPSTDSTEVVQINQDNNTEKNNLSSSANSQDVLENMIAEYNKLKDKRLSKDPSPRNQSKISKKRRSSRTSRGQSSLRNLPNLLQMNVMSPTTYRDLWK